MPEIFIKRDRQVIHMPRDAVPLCVAPGTVREFTNELGNRIRITIEGPTSTSENVLTPMEASELRQALDIAMASGKPLTDPECWERGLPDSIDRAMHGSRAAGAQCWIVLQKAKSEKAPYLVTPMLPMQEGPAKRHAESMAKNNPASSFIVAELKEEYSATVNVERKVLV